MAWTLLRPAVAHGHASSTPSALERLSRRSLAGVLGQ